MDTTFFIFVNRLIEADKTVMDGCKEIFSKMRGDSVE